MAAPEESRDDEYAITPMGESLMSCIATLTRLQLMDVAISMDACSLLFFRGMVHLKELVLAPSNNSCDDKFMKKLSFMCPAIETLNLVSCSLSRIPASGFKNLRSLRLEDCDNFHDEDMSHFITNFATQVEVINVHNCSRITSASLHELHRCTALNKLVLLCMNLDVAEVADIVERCTSLRSLHLSINLFGVRVAAAARHITDLGLYDVFHRNQLYDTSVNASHMAQG
eukprot:TRINITY_DN8994_c0_g1_i1.p1 TRINITY_DN8994_c0_g1~~TRINITY_DN8994_c0_g1_i1.p1  ORF type:complete len:259 (-),score=53.91 TRINITY_DN8994_c0_g1_i1:1268-1951(-)